MAIPVALAADLHALSAAVDDPDVDIVDTLEQLGGAAAAEIGSYLGLSVAITGIRNAFQLDTLSDQGEAIGSSVVIPLTVATAAMPPGAVTTLVLYAGAPGAFVDLAADLAWITGRNISDFGLDEHLMPPPFTPGARSVHDVSTIDQALGVLIGRGSTPEQAARDLALLAARDNTDLPTAASSVLDELP